MERERPAQTRVPGVLGASPVTALVLLLGGGLVIASAGLQGSVVGLRGAREGFSTVVVGAIIAGYYIGFSLGSWRVPELIGAVGHVRVFAAMAAAVAASVMLHALLVTPVAWLLLRTAVGFCTAGVFIVIESWLNELAESRSRGRLLAVYMTVLMGGGVAGQGLLNVADPEGFELFAIAAVLVALAALPISLAPAVTPSLVRSVPMRLRQVFRIAPLALVSSVIAGMNYSALVGMGAVFGDAAGLSVAQISAVISIAIAGGIAGQWPISWLSDRRDRRLVIAGTSLTAAALAVVLPAVIGDARLLVVGMGAFGFLTLPLYSLAVSHINDWLDAQEIVPASASVVLMAGVGSAAGVVAASLAISVAGTAGYLWMLAGLHAGLGLFACHRIVFWPTHPRQRPSRYVTIVTRTGMVASSLATGRSRIPRVGRGRRPG